MFSDLKRLGFRDAFRKPLQEVKLIERLRVKGLGLKFGVWGLGFEVWGLRFRA